MLIVVHYCYRFLCTVVTDSCALLLLFSVHSIYHFLCTRRFCLQKAFHQKLPIRIVDLRPGSVRTAMMKGEGHFWIASAEEAARCICKAIEARRAVQYVTPRWRIVGLLLRWIPERLYRRM